MKAGHIPWKGMSAIFRRRPPRPEPGPVSRGAGAGGAALAEQAADVNGQERRVPTVLCVEDSPTHLKILCRYVEHSLECRALPADGVEEAVMTLLREEPDLVVTDLMMPGLDGLDLLAILRVRMEWRHIPVVVVSALSDLNRIRTLPNLGVKDYIVKPFNPAVAIPRLQKVLANLPPEKMPRPTEPLSFAPGRIPVLLVTARGEAADLVRGVVDPLYEVIAVGSGPEALGAALELRPWAILLMGGLVPWDSAKTLRSLLALKTLDGVRVIPLFHHETGGRALMDAVRRELGPAPFAIAREGGLVTVALEETFAPSCLDAVRKVLDEAMATGTERVVLKLPSRGVGRKVLLAVQKLVEAAKDEEGSNRAPSLKLPHHAADH